MQELCLTIAKRTCCSFSAKTSVSGSANNYCMLDLQRSEQWLHMNIEEVRKFGVSNPKGKNSGFVGIERFSIHSSEFRLTEGDFSISLVGKLQGCLGPIWSIWFFHQ